MKLSLALSTVLFLSTLPALSCSPAFPGRNAADTAQTTGDRENWALEAASAAKTPIELILTGNPSEDQVLLPFLQAILSLPFSKLRLQPAYSLPSCRTHNETANACMQICVFRLSLSPGSDRRFVEFMVEWLLEGFAPVLEGRFARCSELISGDFLPSGDFKSDFLAPGLKIANSYLSPGVPIAQFLALLPTNDFSAAYLSPARELEENCSPGCTFYLYVSSLCAPACDVPACDYQNWTCTCAPHCTPELLSNTDCDSICSFPACNYDNWYCPSSTIPANYTPFENSALRSSSEPEWAKWVIVALSLIVLG